MPKLSKAKEKKKLDAALSRYVRASNADESGYVSCFTCGVKKLWKECDCGHFITRAKLATRFLYKPSEGLVNVMPQCKRCNGFLGGQQFVFARKLDEIYGEGTAENILFLSNMHVDFTAEEYKELRKHYDDLFRELHK